MSVFINNHLFHSFYSSQEQSEIGSTVDDNGKPILKNLKNDWPLNSYKDKTLPKIGFFNKFNIEDNKSKFIRKFLTEKEAFLWIKLYSKIDLSLLNEIPEIIDYESIKEEIQKLYDKNYIYKEEIKEEDFCKNYFKIKGNEFSKYSYLFNRMIKSISIKSNFEINYNLKYEKLDICNDPPPFPSSSSSSLDSSPSSALVLENIFENIFENSESDETEEQCPRPKPNDESQYPNIASYKNQSCPPWQVWPDDAYPPIENLDEFFREYWFRSEDGDLLNCIEERKIKIKGSIDFDSFRLHDNNNKNLYKLEKRFPTINIERKFSTLVNNKLENKIPIYDYNNPPLNNDFLSISKYILHTGFDWSQFNTGVFPELFFINSNYFPHNTTTINDPVIYISKINNSSSFSSLYDEQLLQQLESIENHLCSLDIGLKGKTFVSGSRYVYNEDQRSEFIQIFNNHTKENNSIEYGTFKIILEDAPFYSESKDTSKRWDLDNLEFNSKLIILESAYIEETDEYLIFFDIDINIENSINWYFLSKQNKESLGLFPGSLGPTPFKSHPFFEQDQEKKIVFFTTNDLYNIRYKQKKDDNKEILLKYRKQKLNFIFNNHNEEDLVLTVEGWSIFDLSIPDPERRKIEFTTKTGSPLKWGPDYEYNHVNPSFWNYDPNEFEDPDEDSPRYKEFLRTKNWLKLNNESYTQDINISVDFKINSWKIKDFIDYKKSLNIYPLKKEKSLEN